ncbi:UDP-glucose 4-epimerase GalE [Alisedimentitalea sp. MJ-SS2]|uniref:UDP-glucose 4-epimerase GalE n=1 Tax=Aliisedimentitalea sp. MJ-SS2 TaxID=3049795 RepID=UPI00290BEF6C|nr:UDP-glucose 4-epimerase GalE [Alisedimentitalea sp. MJ-SS2]MDU8925957.1 UDP-glucose 4-epimerase GalE [Alisedimentitalea sp. MJ-SS2]
MQNVLVTGGAGYIGSHACKALARAGYNPVVFDNLSRGHADAVKWGPLVQGDLRDNGLLRQTLDEHHIDAVMHFAAFAYVGESTGQPEMYYDNNVGGMISLLQAMRDAEVGRIVFSSSCATYGTPETLPITEDAPQDPINPYGRTKLICEWILRDAATAHGLRFAALRYFNAAGADPDGEIGERHDPETHLLPLALMAAAGQSELQVFGTDYPTPDGTCIRDYIHVDDLARAHVLAIEYLGGSGDNLALNLGTGRGQSVQEVIASVERVTGKVVARCLTPRRDGDPAELTADPGRAAKVLGFRAHYTDLDEIVAHAAPWFGHAETK